MGRQTFGLRTGLLKTIAHAVSKAVDGYNVWIVMLIFCALVLVATTFISHTVGAMVILPIVQTVGSELPVRPSLPVLTLRLLSSLKSFDKALPRPLLSLLTIITSQHSCTESSVPNVGLIKGWRYTVFRVEGLSDCCLQDPHPKLLVMAAALMCSGAMGLPVSLLSL